MFFLSGPNVPFKLVFVVLTTESLSPSLLLAKLGEEEVGREAGKRLKGLGFNRQTRESLQSLRASGGWGGVIPGLRRKRSCHL